MANPNNCATCDHKQHPDGGHCYMFHDEPTTMCAKHTANTALHIAMEQSVKTARMLIEGQRRMNAPTTEDKPHG